MILWPIIFLICVAFIIAIKYVKSGIKFCVIGLQITVFGGFIMLIDNSLSIFGISVMILGYIWSFVGLIKE